MAHPAQLVAITAWQPGTQDAALFACCTWLATTTRFSVHNVVAYIRPWPAVSISKLGRKYNKWLREENARVCKATLKAFNKVGIPDASSCFVDGPNKAGLITQAAQAADADVIIRSRTGTTTDQLIRDSGFDVLVAPAQPKPLSKRGVTRVSCVVTDIERLDAVQHAAALALKFQVDLRIIALTPVGATQTLEFGDELVHSWREAALAFLDRAHDVIAAEHPQLKIVTDISSGTTLHNALHEVKWKKGDVLYVFAPRSAGALSLTRSNTELGELLACAPAPVWVGASK